MADGWDLRAAATIPVVMIGELDYVEVAIKELVINSLLVVAVIIDEPNTVQTVSSAVIAHTKYPTVVFPKGGATPLVRSAHHGKRRNWYGSGLTWAHRSDTP
jgi:hypothetical protein